MKVAQHAVELHGGNGMMSISSGEACATPRYFCTWMRPSTSRR